MAETKTAVDYTYLSDLAAIARTEEILRARGVEDIAEEVYALGCALGSEEASR